MAEVIQTDLDAAGELASSLRSAATGASSGVVLGTCDVALGPAVAGVSAATSSSTDLVRRLAERCQALSVGVELAAQQTMRADQI